MSCGPPGGGGGTTIGPAIVSALQMKMISKIIYRGYQSHMVTVNMSSSQGKVLRWHNRILCRKSSLRSTEVLDLMCAARSPNARPRGAH